MDHFIAVVGAAILFICSAALAIVTAADAFLGHQMALAGMPPGLQVVVTLVVLAFVLAGVIRLLGGPLLWLIIVLVVLLMLHRTAPGLFGHQPPPAGPAPAGDGVHV